MCQYGMANEVFYPTAASNVYGPKLFELSTSSQDDPVFEITVDGEAKILVPYDGGFAPVSASVASVNTCSHFQW